MITSLETPVVMWRSAEASPRRSDESKISGTLPTLAALSALHTILLANNPELSGTLPSSLGGRLEELDLSRTRLSGSIGVGIGGLAGLRRLQLDHTSFVGTLPTELGRLTALESLFVHESPGLSGTLPTELGRCTALLHGASFAKTRISGTLPTQLGRATRLRQLWLNKAHFSGSLPSHLGRMASLNQLEVHANRMSGTLPSELHRLKLRQCVLTNAQGPHQPLHGMRPVDEAAADTNRFACPLPPLPQACMPHLVHCSQDPAELQPKGRSRGTKPRLLRLGRGRMRRRRDDPDARHQDA